MAPTSSGFVARARTRARTWTLGLYPQPSSVEGAIQNELGSLGTKILIAEPNPLSDITATWPFDSFPISKIFYVVGGQ